MLRNSIKGSIRKMYKTFKIKKNNLNQGFSLVEMLVAVGIFMSIMTIAITSLISIIGANKKTQAIKNTIDSVTFAIEDISRDMRVGYGYSCSTDLGNNWVGDCSVGGNAVKFTNASTKKQTIYRFYGATDNPTKAVLTKTIGNPPAEVALISQDANVNISDMKFYVMGATCEFGGGACVSKTQPRAIITASGIISVKGNNTSFNLQTGLSQRPRDRRP